MPWVKKFESHGVQVFLKQVVSSSNLRKYTVNLLMFSVLSMNNLDTI